MLSWLGVIVAGVLNGSFAVPMKTARAWKFPHIWAVFSLLAMAIIPWGGVAIAVPDMRGILSSVPLRGWLMLGILGLIWGVASLLYGVAVDLLGIALGFSIQLGLSIVLGALIPLAWTGEIAVRSLRDVLYFSGLAVMVVGVVLCSQAGGNKHPGRKERREHFRKGLIIAILGGIGAPLLNVGIQYGISLLRASGQIPTSAAFSVRTYVAWAVFLAAAAVTQAGWCGWQIAKTRGFALFSQAGTLHDALGVGVMALVWAASLCIYGVSAIWLGKAGTSIGWPIFVGLIVLTSNLWGVVLGEWKGATPPAVHRMIVGCIVLVLAAFLIGQGNRG
jgi:L-rhamnose-H+ transport protein